MLNKNHWKIKINRNKKWCGPLGLSVVGMPPSVNAKRSQQNKICRTKTRGINISGIKIGGDPQTLGDGDPRCKY